MPKARGFSITKDGVLHFPCGKAGRIDPEDAPLVSDYTLITDKRKSDGRIVARAVTKDGKYFMLHRLILDAPSGVIVDHVNGDTLDNRRSNLRLCNPTENSQNARLSVRSTTGFKGVFFRRNRFIALIGVRKTRKQIGCFKSAEAAARAYDAAAREHFGEFACLNFPNPGEQSVHRGSASK